MFLKDTVKSHNRENDHASFDRITELIRYQNAADFHEIWDGWLGGTVAPLHDTPLVKNSLNIKHYTPNNNTHTIFLPVILFHTPTQYASHYNPL